MGKIDRVLDEVLDLIFVLGKMDKEVEEHVKHGRKQVQRDLMRQLKILSQKIEYQLEQLIDPVPYTKE